MVLRIDSFNILVKWKLKYNLSVILATYIVTYTTDTSMFCIKVSEKKSATFLFFD